MIFLKGLVHGFGQKLAIIHFRRNRPGKCVSRYSRKKKMHSLTIITRNWKSRKIGIFPNGLVHRLGRKVSIFSSFHLRQNRPGKYISYIVERKIAFLDLKKKTLKKANNWDVFKGVIPKLAIFPSFHFRQNRPGNCVSRYSKKKKTPLSTM